MSPPPRRLLLTPGPLTTSEAVKAAAAGPDECPRERDFGKEIKAVVDRLHQVAMTSSSSHAFALLGGPGTAAVESALGSLVPADGKLLVLNNGAYGARAAEIARRLGIAVEEWGVDWCSQPSDADWAVRLDTAGCSHAFWVHHETTTGMLNPLKSFVEACRHRGVVSMVDAMSSFGGTTTNWREVPVDVFITSSNKCLQGLPGLGIVGVRRHLLKNPPAPRSLALDLVAHIQSLERLSEFPFTPPIPIVRALRVALDELLQESLRGRVERYERNYNLVWEALTSRGFEPLLSNGFHSKLLTAWREPKGFRFEDFHDFLRSRNVTVYPGKMPGADSFRTGHIGDLDEEDQRVVIQAIDEWLTQANA